MQRIVFMGTPEFSVPSLKILLEACYEILAVVTPPDRPAGRGRKLKACPVKEFAVENELPVLQPEKLRDPEFTDALRKLNPDIIVVVAFRMLPEVVWQLPKKGTFNLHSSLLPDYRGAAPMNHAIINGEKETGVTTFLLDHEIDTGKILFREKVAISDDMNVGDLHDILMIKGAELVLKTVSALESGDVNPVDQNTMENPQTLHPAPKFTKEDIKIDWRKKATEVINFVRGLSPYPTAFTHLISPDQESHILKVYKITRTEKSAPTPGVIDSDGKSFLHIATGDKFVSLESLQLAGKKRMNISDFLRGFSIDPDWKMQ